MFRKVCQWTCTAIILAVFTLPASALAKLESHDFTLYQGKGITNPYVLEYEIILEREGLVHVRMTVTSSDKKMKNPLVVGIANKQKRKIRTYANYNSKNQGVVVRHAVDSRELKIGRTYVVYIANRSAKRAAKGSITIDYPAGDEEHAPPPPRPDLAVTRVWLDKECRVQVAVTNPGPADLAPVYYQKNVPELYLYRNGKPWGGVNLAVLDPRKRLVRKGGQAVYTSNLKISGTEQIRAVIDNRNMLREGNEKNNSLTAPLTCETAPPAMAPLKPVEVQAMPMGKPDLAVQSVRLTKDCRVMVTLINNGPGALPNSAWEQQTSPTLMLYRNGKSWGGANLVVLDPQRRLQSVHGRARYVSNLKVAAQTNIQAVIDYHGILDEKDEINNAKVAPLQCQ